MERKTKDTEKKVLHLLKQTDDMKESLQEQIERMEEEQEVYFYNNILEFIINNNNADVDGRE